MATTTQIKATDDRSVALFLTLELRDAILNDMIAMATLAGAEKYVNSPPSKEWTKQEWIKDIEKYWLQKPEDREDTWIDDDGNEFAEMAYFCIKEIARKGGGKDDKLLRKYANVKKKKKKKGLWDKIKKTTSGIAGSVKNVASSLSPKDLALGLVTGGTSLLVKGAVSVGQEVFSDAKDKAKETVKSASEKVSAETEKLQTDFEKNFNVSTGGKVETASVSLGGGSAGPTLVGPPPKQVGKTAGAPPISAGDAAKRTGDAAALMAGAGAGCAVGGLIFIPILWFAFRIWDSYRT